MSSQPAPGRGRHAPTRRLTARSVVRMAAKSAVARVARHDREVADVESFGGVAKHGDLGRV